MGGPCGRAGDGPAAAAGQAGASAESRTGAGTRGEPGCQRAPGAEPQAAGAAEQGQYLTAYLVRRDDGIGGLIKVTKVAQSSLWRGAQVMGSHWPPFGPVQLGERLLAGSNIEPTRLMYHGGNQVFAPLRLEAAS